jgi:hypothetical protein
MALKAIIMLRIVFFLWLPAKNHYWALVASHAGDEYRHPDLCVSDSSAAALYSANNTRPAYNKIKSLPFTATLVNL